MTPTEWIALGAVGATSIAGILGHAVNWGRHTNAMEATQSRIGKAEDRIVKLEETGAADKLKALADRINAVESDMSTLVKSLQQLQVSNAKVETKIDGLVEQVKDLNASIRWMREPQHDSSHKS